MMKNGIRGLTPLQNKILKLLLTSRSHKEIIEKLNINEEALAMHEKIISEVLRKGDNYRKSDNAK